MLLSLQIYIFLICCCSFSYFLIVVIVYVALLHLLNFPHASRRPLLLLHPPPFSLSHSPCSPSSLSLLLCHLNEHVGGEGLGTLDGQAESAIPDEGGEHAEGTGHAKQYGVIVHLLHAVVLQQDTGVGIYIGPGVLDLAGFGKDWGHHLVDLGDKLEQLIVGQMLEGELSLAGVTRIGLAEHSMAVAGHNLE